MEFIQSKWQLDDLYKEFDTEAFQKDIEILKEKASSFEAFRPELKNGLKPERFLEIFKSFEELNELAHKLGGFTQLQVSADTQDSALLSQMVQTRSVITEVSNKTMFFTLWFRGLSDKDAAPYIEAAEGSRYYLNSLRLRKPYMLSEAEEKLINVKNMTGSAAMINVYNAITNRYVFNVTIDGEEKHLTRGEVMSYAHSAKREERKAAYEELYRVYGNDGNILGQIYQSIARDWDQENLNFRNYNTPISVRNLNNDIPDDVVDLLLSTCQKNKNVFADFFRLKSKLLGLDELHRYDLYAPLASDESKVSFDEAYKTVIKSYNEFDPEFAEMAERVYKHHHIDSEVRHGKRSGAFCHTVLPQFTPWVLVNFQGKEDDTSTLAHELGHAIHSMMAADKNVFEQHSCLPLAETASTFGEMLLSDYLEQRVTDKKVLSNMLIKQMDDNYATIQRQSYFALFEKQAHKMIADGADVNALAEAYIENLRDQFGDSMIVDDYFRWEWVSIPHIYHTPFYVYAYSFGQLLVLALYNTYKEEGKSFIPRYKEMLHKGGSQRPADLLLDAGFDFTKESFWQGGFDILKGKVERLKTLTE
ncbi:MAG: M3 family oligoendopeptidase [Anaerolineaceae bacterium]|nr:M3 family oligoendopeptidase [Anaerolineaceae bacterium]